MQFALELFVAFIVLQEPLMTNLFKLDVPGIQELLPEIPLWVKSPDFEKVSANSLLMWEPFSNVCHLNM
jgi:hypothetical protein